MFHHSPKRLLVRLLVLFILALTLAGSALAQMKKQAKNSTMDGRPMMTAGMRRMTMAERRKAAARNTQRKLVAGHKNQAVQHNRGEVKK